MNIHDLNASSVTRGRQCSTAELSGQKSLIFESLRRTSSTFRLTDVCFRGKKFWFHHSRRHCQLFRLQKGKKNPCIAVRTRKALVEPRQTLCAKEILASNHRRRCGTIWAFIRSFRIAIAVGGSSLRYCPKCGAIDFYTVQRGAFARRRKQRF